MVGLVTDEARAGRWSIAAVCTSAVAAEHLQFRRFVNRPKRLRGRKLAPSGASSMASTTRRSGGPGVKWTRPRASKPSRSRKRCSRIIRPSCAMEVPVAKGRRAQDAAGVGTGFHVTGRSAFTPPGLDAGQPAFILVGVSKS